MDLYEIEGKTAFSEYGIAIDNGVLIWEGEAIPELEYPCVVKAQALCGHRGQRGGIKVVRNAGEMPEVLKGIFCLELDGERTRAALAVPFLQIANEHYLGITLDTVGRRRILLYSAEGGMDIEDTVSSAESRHIRVDITEGIDKAQLACQIGGCGVASEKAQKISEIAVKLNTLFLELDATTAEINPLAELDDGSFVAADAKLSIDDNALYRQKDRKILPRKSKATPLEQEAIDAGMAYVEVDSEGTVGLMVFGAGLGMATLDTVRHYGLKPFNFMDMGSRMNGNCFRLGARLIKQNPHIEAVVVNGFGGQFSTAQVASWIMEGLDELKGLKIPIVVKLRGYKAQEGWDMLEALGVPIIRFGTTDDAVKLAARLLEDKV